MKNVRIVDGTVVEVMVVPFGMKLADQYPADLIKDCTTASDDVEPGWITKDGGKTFSAPPSPAAPPAPTQYNFLGFLGLFTQAEQAAIVSSDNFQVRLFCLMAAGANFVDLTDPRVVAGTNQLETLGLIAKGRAAEVLAGTAPSA